MAAIKNHGRSRISWRKMLAAIVVGFLGMAGLASAAAPADKGPEAEEAAAVLRAVQRGAAYLKERQQQDGTWSQAAFPQAATPLCLYALLRSGADPQDPGMKKAAAEVLAQPIEQLYLVSVQILALAAADPKEYAAAIQERVDWLEKAQAQQGRAAGGWSYTIGTDRGDGSCTRFALLALQRAAAVGVNVQPETWRRAEGYWLQGQHADGGWGYMPETTTPTVTMTLAGMASLAITRQHTGPANVETSSAAIVKGHAWLKDRLDPKAVGWPQASFRLYWFHCGERAATLNRDSRLGPTDWRKDWLPALLADQNPQSGGWTKEAQFDLTNTCLALLCLSPEPEGAESNGNGPK